MKSAPFEYSRPADIDEACAMLAADENARVIAGGQTLVPMMAMRLARPTRLVDINRIAGLDYIKSEGDAVSIGAITRQCDLEFSNVIARDIPLMAKAIPWIGHAATRARGTIGGSLANADPAAEQALIAVTLDSVLHARENKTTTEIKARDFFVAAMVTALPSTACLIGVKVPVWRGAWIGTGFQEVNARRSDFAFVSSAVQVQLDADGKCTRIAIGVGAATDSPMRLDSAEQQLVGTSLDAAKVKDAVTAALADIEALDDLHATAAYRKRVAVSMACRAVTEARAAALGEKTQGNPHAH
jgi:carbon-monoxide dehydrogenase medium subunit